MSKTVPNPSDKSGVPASLLVSIGSAIVVFSLAEIQNTFTLADSFVMRFVLIGYVALGLALSFFWKRLERSPFLKLSAGLFLFGVWASMFMTTLAPVLWRGENPLVHGMIPQQFGLGFIAASAFMLIVAILQNQKMVPSLLFSALGAVSLVVTGAAGFFVKPSQDGVIASHSAKSHDDGEEISAHDSKSDDHTTLSAKAHAEDDSGDEHASAAHHKDESHHEEKVDEEHHDDKSHADDHASDHSEKHAPAHAQKSPAHAAPHAVKAEKPKKSSPASLDHAVEHDKPAQRKKVAAASKGDDHGKGAAWSYEAGHSSPEHWGEIADEYRKCSIGQQQSPINIPSAWPTMADVSLDYKLTPVSVIDNGKTIEFKVGDQNYARIAGRKYKLVQFHIHTPSEHWIDGRSAPLEIHFVHKDEKNNLAVVGVMVEAGAEQKVFGEMWGYAPQAIGVPASPRGKVFNIATLLPSVMPKVYRYRGSLTTPPCSENVIWSVASEKITFSKEQINAFRVRYKMNARPIQKQSGNAH